jgi:hypothetical protein
MVGPPIYTTEKFKDEETLKKGENFMRDKGRFFKKGDVCYLVELHKRNEPGWCYDGKWYEIHCINKHGGKYFKSVSSKEWLEYINV